MAQRIDESGFILGSGPSKEPEPVPATSSGPLKSSSVKLSSPVKEPEPVPTTPSGPSLSQRVLTPVPDSVLARHKQLCGQDSVRRRAAISPWRREEGVDQYNDPDARADREEARRQKEEERAVERERKRLRLDVREAVVSNTTERIRKTKTTRALGEFKSLAHLSSDKSSSPSRSSPSDRIPLAGKSGNANPLRRHSSAVEGPVCERDEDWPTRQPRLPAVTAFSRNHRQDAADDTPKASARPQPIAQSAFPPRQHLARQAEAERPRTTPRKRRAEHHHVTPPKSRTPQHVHQQETLFVLPAPPRQPVFEPVRPAPESIGWQPVSMEAETLMTWSLGGGAGEPEVNKDVPASDNDDCESVSLFVKVLLTSDRTFTAFAVIPYSRRVVP